MCLLGFQIFLKKYLMGKKRKCVFMKKLKVLQSDMK